MKKEKKKLFEASTFDNVSQRLLHLFLIMYPILVAPTQDNVPHAFASILYPTAFYTSDDLNTKEVPKRCYPTKWNCVIMTCLFVFVFCFFFLRSVFFESVFSFVV